MITINEAKIFMSFSEDKYTQFSDNELSLHAHQ